MRLCAVAQHDPPELRKPLSAVSCDSSVLHPRSIVPRILRFLYVSLHRRNLRGLSIRMTLPCLTWSIFPASQPFSSVRTIRHLEASLVASQYHRIHSCPGPISILMPQ